MEPTNTGTGAGDQTTGGQPVNNGMQGTDASFNPPWLNFQPTGTGAGQNQGDGTTPPPVVTPPAEPMLEPTMTAENVTPTVATPAPVETQVEETPAPATDEAQHEEEFDPFVNPFDSGEDEEVAAEAAPFVPPAVETPTMVGDSLQILESFYASMKTEEKDFHTELNDVHQEMIEENVRHDEAVKELEDEKHRIKNGHREKLAKYKEVLSKLNEIIIGPNTKESKKPTPKAAAKIEEPSTGEEASDSFLGA